MRSNWWFVLGLSIGLVSAAHSQEDIEAFIQRTNTPPTIDGLGDDAVWAAATAHNSDDEFFTVVGEEAEDEDDLSVTWKALWDDTNLYVFVDVTDNQIFNDEECNWDDDGIELYIDAQNVDSEDFRPENNDPPPDGVPAYQLTAIAGDRTACDKYSDDESEHPSPFGWGINSYHDIDPDHEVTQYPQESDTGTSVIIDENHYTLEVAFPWEALEETPANIQANELGMGFTVVINDDDDPFDEDIGGARDSQFAWATEANDFWMRSDVFPQVQLSDETVGGGTPGDYDGNDILNDVDIDILAEAVRNGDMDAKFDVDGSGTVDLADHDFWVSDLRKTWSGDANMDGEFNSSDFVFVFQAGLYETGNAAGYAQGDWDGDGVFGSGDLVKSFQIGGFEMGPLAGGVASVPEPAGILLPILAVGFFVGRRRK